MSRWAYRQVDRPRSAKFPPIQVKTRLFKVDKFNQNLSRLMPLPPTSDPTTSAQIIPTNHEGVRNWVTEMATLCQPDQIHWCDGSEEEKEQLTRQAVEKGILIKLNQKKLPGCYYHRSNP